MCLLRGTDWVFKCNSGLNKNPTFCPHSVFMCFVWIWEQTAIISLYNITWLVCITKTECVYCAVRTGSIFVSHKLRSLLITVRKLCSTCHIRCTSVVLFFVIFLLTRSLISLCLYVRSQLLTSSRTCSATVNIFFYRLPGNVGGHSNGNTWQ